MKHPIISKSEVKKLFPYRGESSHKGDNGRVCIIGGSIDYYGAPIFAGLGAVHSGADLVYIYVPESNFDCSRSFYPDFLIRKFDGDHLSDKNLDKLLDLANSCHCVVVGPGIGLNEEALKAAAKLIAQIQVPCIIDADALRIVQNIKLPYQTLITPHHGEFERLSGQELSADIDVQVAMVRQLAENLSAQVLLKGQTDIIAKADGNYRLNTTGNAGMTVGGSGDILTGLIAGISAQGATLFEAASIATFILGVAGEGLFQQKSYAYSATDLALEIPFVLKRMVG